MLANIRWPYEFDRTEAIAEYACATSRASKPSWRRCGIHNRDRFIFPARTLDGRDLADYAGAAAERQGEAL